MKSEKCHKFELAGGAQADLEAARGRVRATAEFVDMSCGARQPMRKPPDMAGRWASIEEPKLI